MKEPLNPLPWYSNDDVYIFIHSTDPVEDECVCQDLYRDDAEYLVLAVNNFPKAIELIQEFVNRVEKREIVSTKTYNKFKEFLKEIES